MLRLKILMVVVGVLAAVGSVAALIDLGFPDAVPQPVLRVFNLNEERNLPTWYSSILLFAGAVASWWKGRRCSQGRERRSWLILAVALAAVSFDEFAGLHERASEPLKELLGGMPALFHFAWVLPGFILVAVLFVLVVPALRNLDPAARRGLLAAGGIYLAGAIGMELPGGYVAATAGRDNLSYLILTVLEESLEMAGASVYLWVVWERLAVSEPLLHPARPPAVDGDLMPVEAPERGRSRPLADDSTVEATGHLNLSEDATVLWSRSSSRKS